MSVNLYDSENKQLIPFAGNPKPEVAQELGDLSNVVISSPTNTQVLRFNATTQKWVNQDNSVVMDLDEIADVDISNIADGDIIAWDDTNSKWVNTQIDFATMTGATASANGAKGLVPAPLVADKDKFLKGDGTWEAPYTAGYGIDITSGVIKAKTFVGTTAEWEALDSTAKAAFDAVSITDDHEEGTDIQIAYVEAVPTSGIQDIIYGLLSYDADSATVADGFLDSETAFTKTTVGSYYKYTSDDAEVSLDGVSYDKFASLEYDGTKFVLTYEDTTTANVALGDTFYFRVLDASATTYYVGNKANQTTALLSTMSVDAALSTTSDNPVKNKVVTAALNNKADAATTLAEYGITNAYTKTETDAAIDAAAARAYKPGGDATLATLPALSAEYVGYVYNMTADFTTTADFKEGAGIEVTAGNEVAIVDIGSSGSSVFKYNVLGGIVDLGNYVQKSQTAGVIKNDGTIKATTDAVTQNSADLVTSGAVYTALQGKANSADLGTAAAKNATTSVTSGSSDLVTSGAVYSYVDTMITSALTAGY